MSKEPVYPLASKPIDALEPTYASRPMRAEVAAVLLRLKAGDRIRIRQLVRVGSKTWPAEITGVFRHVDSLATGLATHRLPSDDIIVPIVHFTKDNKEMSSIAVETSSFSNWSRSARSRRDNTQSSVFLRSARASAVRSSLTGPLILRAAR